MKAFHWIRKQILPKRRLILNLNTDLTLLEFEERINNDPKSIFEMHDGRLIFKNWSDKSPKLDRCSFSHASVKFKVSAQMILEHNRSLCFSINSLGTFFVVFFIIGILAMNFSLGYQIMNDIGVLSIIGINLVFVFFLFGANKVFVEAGIQCFLKRLHAELSILNIVNMQYSKE